MVSVGCLLVGHDDMLIREAGWMWLRCQRCGRDTPGWPVRRAATHQLDQQRGNSGHGAARWNLLEGERSRRADVKACSATTIM